VRVLLSLWL